MHLSLTLEKGAGHAVGDPVAQQIERHQIRLARIGLGANGVEAELLLNGMLAKERLLDLVENFILFDESKPGKTRKVVARNHQVLGVNKAVASVNRQQELKQQFPPEERLRYRVVESGFVYDRIRAHPLTGSGLGASIFWGQPWAQVPPKTRHYSHDGYFWSSLSPQPSPA
jgi:hypothetical protein